MTKLTPAQQLEALKSIGQQVQKQDAANIPAPAQQAPDMMRILQEMQGTLATLAAENTELKAKLAVSGQATPQPIASVSIEGPAEFQKKKAETDGSHKTYHAMKVTVRAPKADGSTRREYTDNYSEAGAARIAYAILTTDLIHRLALWGDLPDELRGQAQTIAQYIASQDR